MSLVCDENGVAFCSLGDSTSCLDSHRSLHQYYLVGASCSLCGSLFVILTYLFTPSLREHPSIIIFSRSIFDFGFSLSFITLFFFGSTDSGLSSLMCGEWSCFIWGPFNVFVFLCSEGYFLSLLIDLYLSISNPFLDAAHYTKIIRLTIILSSLTSVILVHIFWRYDYNRDLEYCTIGATEQLEDWNMFNWMFIFFPTFLCMTAPWIVAFYAFNRLTRGLPNTFFIRIAALYDQIWFKLHAISSSSLGVVDAIVWIARKCQCMSSGRTINKKNMNELIDTQKKSMIDKARRYNKRQNKGVDEVNVHPISPDIIYHTIESDDNQINNHKIHLNNHAPPHKKKKTNCCKRLCAGFGVTQQNQSAQINRALRREVVAYTTDGIAQSVLATRELFSDIEPNSFADIRPTFYPRQATVSTVSDDLEDVRKNDHNARLPSVTARKFKISIKHNVTLLQAAHNESNLNITHGDRFCCCFNLNMKMQKKSEKERLFTDYAPLIFQYVRNAIVGISDCDYISSIIPSNAEDQLKVLDVKYGEGKSGAFFYFSADSKFIVKTISATELKYLLSFLEAYVHHLEENRSTILSRIVGIHSCKFYNIVKHFVVMENVFLADLKPNEVYDLKGSWYGRSSSSNPNSKVMKDLDLKRYIVLNESTRRKILHQLDKDTQFLCDANVIDYSLLLGIYYMKIAFNNDEEKDEPIDDVYGGVRASLIEGPGIYYFGIIDAIQMYTARKRCETWCKRWILRADRDGISCVEPRAYKTRFMKYMKNIIISNDKWHQESNIKMNRFGEENVSIYPSKNIYYKAMKSVRQKRLASISGGYNYQNRKKKTSASLQPPSAASFVYAGSSNFSQHNIIHEDMEIDEDLFPAGHALLRCDQCGQHINANHGKTDKNDGNWYCNTCWLHFYQ
eukprot:636547_1